MLELEPKARPMPVGHVVLTLVAEGPGTRVTMIEEPASRLLSSLMTPVGHLLLAFRIKESLRRLKRLAEGDAPRPSGSLPHQSPGAR